MAGDAGIWIGAAAPSAKFWLGVDWLLDFAPDVVVAADPAIPVKYTDNGSIVVLHGPQFFIGPTIGVGFGH